MLPDSARILIVDHSSIMMCHINDIAKANGYQCLDTTDPTAALELLSKEHFDLIILGNDPHKMDGTRFIRKMKELCPGVQIVITEECGTIDSAIEAFRNGAIDYIRKPSSIEELNLTVKQIFERFHFSKNDFQLAPSLIKFLDGSLTVARSTKMRQIFQTLVSVAPTEASLLIVGEQGTEKELVVEALHKISNRTKEKLVRVNCSAFSESGLENELFGQESDYADRSSKSKPGKLELVGNGTLCLDEIGKMPLTTQTKLLQAIKENQYWCSDIRKKVVLNARIVSSNENALINEINKGSFRKDLLHRLNVVQIEIPPLRNRREDIFPLAHYFLKYYNGKNNRCVHEFNADAMNALERYSWPGNTNELMNVVERSVILTQGDQIQLSAIPDNVKKLSDGFGRSEVELEVWSGMTLHEMEKTHIIRTLKRNNGNRTRASIDLGITRRTLQNKLKEYSIEIFSNE